MGPTGMGKTELAVALTRALPCDIISVDSAMVYRGLDIGTAKPGPEVLAAAPHRLLDIRDPAEAYSAGQFRRDALAEITPIVAAGRIPLLVGGTMLYFRALERGFAQLPPAAPDVRAELERAAVRHGWPWLHAELARCDPHTARRIHPHDAQRIQRALEVVRLTGRGPTELYRAAPVECCPYTFVKIALVPAERRWLHTRIEARFDAMLARGFLEEVAALKARSDLHSAQPALRAVGYRQLWAHLAGECEFPEARRRAIAATRQLAKRQMTWLRRETGLRRYAGAGRELVSRVAADLGGLA
jgi:tRNA dimethylallyltransferase